MSDEQQQIITDLERRIGVLNGRLEGHNRQWDALAQALGQSNRSGPALLVELAATMARSRSDLAARCNAAEERAIQLKALEEHWGVVLERVEQIVGSPCDVEVAGHASGELVWTVRVSGPRGRPLGSGAHRRTACEEALRTARECLCNATGGEG